MSSSGQRPFTWSKLTGLACGAGSGWGSGAGAAVGTSFLSGSGAGFTLCWGCDGLDGVGFGWGGVLHSLLMDHLPADERASGFGLVRTVYMLLGSTGSVVVGTLADTAGWATAYGVVGGLLGAGVLAIVG